MWREQHDRFFGEANISIFERQQFTPTLCFMQVEYNFSPEYLELMSRFLKGWLELIRD